MAPLALPAALEALEAAALAVPALLETIRKAPHLPPAELLDGGPIASVGVGLSGGPARLFASRAAQLGLPARFVPPSELAPPSSPPAPSTLVLFSQGLSPNARLAERLRASSRVVLTGVRPDADGPRGAALRRILGPEGFVVSIPADERHEHMVRLQAPIASAYAALLWLARARPGAPWARALDAVPDGWASAFDAARAAIGAELAEGPWTRPVVFVSAGRDPAELHHLAWKWAEGLFSGPPLVVDALELAHGPLQAFFREPRLVVGLVDPGTEALFGRVETVLEPSRHRFVPLRARLPAPLSIVEHDAALDAWLLAALAARPDRIGDWPARGRDAPLYAFEG